VNLKSYSPHFVTSFSKTLGSSKIAVFFLPNNGYFLLGVILGLPEPDRPRFGEPEQFILAAIYLNIVSNQIKLYS